MSAPALIDDRRLRRFARIAAPFLVGAAGRRLGPAAARDRAGAGVEFLDLTPYRPGDDLRRVDWRRSAREGWRGRPIVRRYRDEVAADWLLCVDGSASMSGGGKWRLAAEMATALACALLHAGHRPGLAIFTDTLAAWCPPGRGYRQLSMLAQCLSGYRPPAAGGGSVAGACAERLRAGGEVVLLSDFLRCDAMAPDLRRLAARADGGRALQVLGAGETDLPDGPLILYDRENGAAERVVVSAASRAAATAALAAHRERLRGICRQLGWAFSACVDTDDWERVLLGHLGAMARPAP